MNIDLTERIEQALKELFADTDMFLVDIKQSAGTKIEIFIDCQESNVTIDQCAQTSRALEEVLETEQLVPEKYTLEVSSPGMANPLKVPQQYKKCIGRTVSVLSFDGIKREGILIEYNEAGFAIEEHKPVTKKNKKAEILRHNYLFEAVKSVVKSFEFPKNRV